MTVPQAKAWVPAAAAISAVIALGLGLVLVVPSHDELRSTAVELVPPGAQVTDVGENLGSELIAGPYHATARFTDHASSPEDLYARGLAHAVAEGWEIVRTDAGPGGWQVQLGKLRMMGTMTVSTRSEGSAIVREDREMTGVVIGALFLGSPFAVIVSGEVVTAVRRRRHDASLRHL